ncbi:MAG: hypothetical protein HUU10_07915 [Bacteroidetes bacterium]|nr:hypothetical protein [Bacteroidota bacterium]
MIKQIISFLCLLPLVSACGVYSFTGASIPPHLKRIDIPVFQDKSNSGILSLKETITDEVTNRIITQSSLELASGTGADCRLSASIVSYSNQPYVITQGVASATNRISIRIQVTYQDLVKRETIWEQSFDSWEDYSVGNRSAEEEALKNAITKLSDDIFSKVVSNW